MDQAEEKALVGRLAGLDEQAWEMFCREYSPPLLQFIQLRFHCSLQLAEDIVQMTFVRCVRSIGTFDPQRGRLLGWLKAVASHEDHTSLGKEAPAGPDATVLSLSQDPAGQMLSQIDTKLLPEDVLARRDVQLLVQESLLQINMRYREVLTGKYIDGLRVSQIATKMGLSEKAAESLLSRARDAFRDILLQRVGSQAQQDEILKWI